MSIRNTELWVHGNVTVPESMGSQVLGLTQVDPGLNAFSDVNGTRTTAGAAFVLQPRGASTWFHIPFPTPAVIKSKRATLTWVSILFNIEAPMILQRLVVMEGLTNIFDQNLTITGDHSGGPDTNNTYNVMRDGIRFGIGISLFIRNDAPDQKHLFIVGAGANFQHDWE
jgi:hypothetical protein